MTDTAPLPVGTRIVIAAFGASGVVHMTAPQVFEPLIPRALGSPRAWVLGSGAIELACAAGLASRQRWAPAATTATLAAIWVGNWSMAVAWQKSPRRTRVQRAGAWARLPLQVPLMWWAWRSPTRSAIAPQHATTRTLSQ